MAASKDTGVAHPASERHSEAVDSDVDFAGYDPYIVAITGAGPGTNDHNSASDAEQTTESRKAKLMTWLREHGA